MGASSFAASGAAVAAGLAAYLLGFFLNRTGDVAALFLPLEN